MATKAAVKKTVWVLTTDTDNGTSSSVYATKELGEDAYVSTVNEFYRRDLDRRYGPDAKTFEEAEQKAQDAVDDGSMDFVGLTEEEIEGYSPVVYVVLAVYGGIPGDPALFLNEADAIARYRALAKDFEHQLDGKVDEMTDDELFRQVHDRQDSDDDLYLYETEVK